MRNRGRLVAAVAAGVAAVVLTWLYISIREASLLSQSEPQMVVVSKVDIPGNSVIDAGMFELKPVPSAFAQPRVVTKPEDVQGRVATVPIAAGSQILATMLGDESEGALAYEVPSGQRALSIAAADVMGVGGLVRPGNRVDIIGTFEYGRPTGISQNGTISYADERTETRLMMQDVRVLAVDKEHRRRGAPPRPVPTAEAAAEAAATPEPDIRNVTVLVSLRQAQELILAQEIGTLTLALRSNLDGGRVENLPNLDPITLLGVQTPVKRRPQPVWRELRGGGF
ncbi:MAG: Flp pilus assembly protein CpaB [Acidimicrobiia bacterium]|nr:Flp pilus assembly protein CpaB [Acidimicrobiia bacterium]